MTVYTSAQLVSPISFGWLVPSIVIPGTLALDQFELVAAHELAHVHRLDWLTNLFSHVVGALFFFHPIYHLLNRKLVYLREKICDDWVIQLTGARKRYAQCLLDLVRRKERAIPLALGLNLPSQLESRINAILKNNRRLDCQIRHRLLVVTLTLLLTGLPLLAMAQLVPLRTVELPFFSQAIFSKSEKADDVEKQKMKDEKEYKAGETIKVLDPSAFNTSQENRVFSGPQPGEKLPSLKGVGLGGDFDGKTYDIIAAAKDKPLLLFLQDNSEVGLKGLYIFADTVLPIIDKVADQLQIAVLFLSDDETKLPEYFNEVDQFAKRFQFSVSPDGREGPGVYGLNRNVAQTVIIAKAGKVHHNFAFTQPMIYTNPHLLGAIAQAIDIAPAALEKLLNEKAAKRDKETDLDDESLIAKKFASIRDAVENGKVSRAEATEWLEEMGITWEEGEKLLKKTTEPSQKMDRTWRYDKQRQVKIADPTDFSTPEEKQPFSGPQPGEKLPPLNATSIIGKSKGKTFDFTKTDGHPLVLFLQDDDGAGLRGLYDISRLIAKIANKSKQALHMSIVFLGDEPDTLTQRVSGVAGGIAKQVPKNVLFGISPEGREGPGNYGLNRNVAQTILIAKNGKVLHNFAFTQPTVYADAHVLGAIVQAIGEKPATVEKWLNEASAEGKQMQRDKSKMAREGAVSPEARLKRLRDREGAKDKDREGMRDREGAVSPEARLKRLRDREVAKDKDREGASSREELMNLSREEIVKRFDKDGDGKLNDEEGMAARRALANREGKSRASRLNVQVKDPAEFKKVQNKALFSGPQPGEKLPPLKVMGINGKTRGYALDVIAKANGQPLVLFLQDESRLGLRGLVGISRLLTQIADKSKKKFHISVVFLGDTPDTLAKQSSKIIPHVPRDVLLGISPEGREGPGSYGLNRNVAQTVLIVKDGKVLHNFAFTQPMLQPDPYVLGAVGALIGEKPVTLQKWLNEKPKEDQQMRRGEDSDAAVRLAKRLREMVRKGEITEEEARKRYEKAFPRARENR